MGPKRGFKNSYWLVLVYTKNEVLGDCLQVPIYQYGIKLVTKRFVKYVQKQRFKKSMFGQSTMKIQ